MSHKQHNVTATNAKLKMVDIYPREHEWADL